MNATIQTRTASSARWAVLFGVLALLTMAAGPAGIHLGLLKPFHGFLIFVSGWVLGGLLALIFGLVGLRATRPETGLSGRSLAWCGAFMGAALLGLLVALLSKMGGVPRIHDITTDTADPPAFVAAAKNPDNAGRNMAYPEGAADAAAQQKAGYADLQPFHLDVPPAEAFQRVKEAAMRLNWKITAEDPAAGTLEAEDTSRLFLFVDDIAIRVRPDGTGSRIDVRSLSRVGKGDLGANAARIRRFGQALQGS